MRTRIYHLDILIGRLRAYEREEDLLRLTNGVNDVNALSVKS